MFAAEKILARAHSLQKRNHNREALKTYREVLKRTKDPKLKSDTFNNMGEAYSAR